MNSFVQKVGINLNYLNIYVAYTFKMITAILSLQKFTGSGGFLERKGGSKNEQ